MSDNAHSTHQIKERALKEYDNNREDEYDIHYIGNLKGPSYLFYKDILDKGALLALLLFIWDIFLCSWWNVRTRRVLYD